MTLSEFILLGSAATMAVLFLLVLFEPGLQYRVSAPGGALDAEPFVQLLGSIMNARIFRDSAIEPYTSGESIYAAQLEAIAAARSSVHLEAYLFLRGTAGARFLAALTAAAQRGVKVRVIVDAIGSLITPSRYFEALRAAGGQVAWYQPVRWYTLKRFNNRTHRELLVVDGRIGFVGGAGIADYWLPTPGAGRPWRDTTVRVTGALVAGLQTSFVENWLEANGEILTGPEEFPLVRAHDPEARNKGGVVGIVVNSTPSAGRATRARMLFQLFLASARESILVNSPYFVPDRSARAELIRAVKRGVRVSIVTPNRLNNHPVARLASRRRYGELIAAGVEIHEYQPAMIHAKVMVVDGAWTILGSTNFDNRSFGLNDEVNVALLDRALAARMADQFAHDVAHSTRIDYEQWARRPLGERLLAMLGIALERQE
ncbi:MAG TPA: phospholipase D-like domain-containing protein [Usitatibacter sp.]|nr:phospholipase D-like domain-containing protein [Usitatibacter sp.]